MKKDKLIVFEDKNIRRVWHNGEHCSVYNLKGARTCNAGPKLRSKGAWFFSVVDVVGVLTDSLNSNNYWKVLKHRENQLVTYCNQLKLESSDGKKYLTDCADKKGIFRIIQSIPSKKAEPFKLWLAQIGSDRIDEIENPELLQIRAKEYYEKKGYPKDWIEKRIRGIAIRQELTNEWKERGVDERSEYAILTNEIATATFGVSIKEHKMIKGLNPKFNNINLRDHMTDLELIFNMLGEVSTTKIAKGRNAQGFEENKVAAQDGGEIAGDARKKLEKKSGEKVVTEDSVLHRSVYPQNLELGGKEKVLEKEVIIK